MTDRTPKSAPAAAPPLAFFGLALSCLVAAWLGAARAQGQDSTTSASGPQTSAHPVPLLSTQDVVSVPSGTPKPGVALPPEYRRVDARRGLALLGPIALHAPAQMACADIRDTTARARCDARTSPPAPPKGADE